MPDDDENDEQQGGRSFWSGTIAFGLVSLPVSLYVANRPRPVSLRMLDQDGTPLSRRYFCSRDDQPLSGDDLVRGYEIERDKFIEVSDEELEALAPEKSREIDLRRFVPLNSINPMFFERAYFLVPDEGANKAYRLLAESMESTARAGIATFVMRGKEYLIAIIAERGILRAETLRFQNELRTPAEVGLPSLDKPSADEVRAIAREIDKLIAEKLDRAELADEPSRRLLELIEDKLASGEDVIEAPEIEETEESAKVIDLMQVLARSLGVATGTEADESGKKKTKAKVTEHPSSQRAKTKAAGKINADMSKSELYEHAKKLDIAGRSQMSKQELLRAIKNAS